MRYLLIHCAGEGRLCAQQQPGVIDSDWFIHGGKNQRLAAEIVGGHQRTLVGAQWKHSSPEKKGGTEKHLNSKGFGQDSR